jgi:hypothetical protein
VGLGIILLPNTSVFAKFLTYMIKYKIVGEHKLVRLWIYSLRTA